jgi:hypothetical protein
MSGPRLREVEGKYTFEFRCDPWDEAAPVTHRVLVWRAFEAILNDEPGFTVEKKGARLTVTVPIACWMPTAWPLNAATRNRRSGRVRERRHAVRDVEGEPRISAEALGKMLRYRNPRRLRHFARQKLPLLELLGPVLEVERRFSTGRGDVRIGSELLFNKSQAQFLATRRRGSGVDATIALLASHGSAT